MTSGNPSDAPVTTATPSQPAPSFSFSYSAQTNGGDVLTGTIDAIDINDAMARLTSLGLRTISLNPTSTPRPKRLRGDDFAVFNQQLGQLASAGLPLEQGLRLIAQDMRSGRLARTVDLVATELERGVPLGEAFGKHQSHFPPLYGRLMDAGIRSGNLPAMLLNLSKYSELTQQLRAALWRAVAYPLAVFIGLMVVALFLSMFVMPQFNAIFGDFRIELPTVTKMVISVSEALPVLLAGVIVLIALAMIVLWALRRSGSSVGETIVLSIPLIGPVIRRGMLARWCDAMKLAVDAGMDLPAAFDLASQAINSKPLRHDSELLLNWLHSSPSAGSPPANLRVVPNTVAATMALAVRDDQLSRSLGTLAQMYTQQVEQRTYAIPAILGPFLLIFVTVVIGIVIFAMVAPLLLLLKTVSGGSW